MNRSLTAPALQILPFCFDCPYVGLLVWVLHHIPRVLKWKCGIYKNVTLTNTYYFFFNSEPLNFVSPIGLKL